MKQFFRAWIRKSSCTFGDFMTGTKTTRPKTAPVYAAVILLVIVLTPMRVFPGSPRQDDPWTQNELVQPADFARELRSAKNSPPTIVYVGVHTLYQGGHIPGALFHGAASSEQGLNDLKKWAETVPRATSLVIYCGCCPFDRCPNIRPAYVALHGLGFAHLRVLTMPTSFATDWVEKGYPTEKGS
jgi:hypothetical protein